MRPIELINLTLGEIRRAAQSLSDTENGYQYLIHRAIIDGGEPGSIRHNQERLREMEEVLNNCRLSLRKTMEDLIGYLEAHDSITPVDVALSRVAHELIYEHKTEQDYYDEWYESDVNDMNANQ